MSIVNCQLKNKVFYYLCTMLHFRKITTDDKFLIRDFTFGLQETDCYNSFANLMSWKVHSSELAIISDCLCIRHQGNRLSYQLIPHIATQTEIRLAITSAIRQLLSDAAALGEQFRMIVSDKRIKQIIEEEFADSLSVQFTRDCCDYIYEREKLTTLSGKHLQQKRNHINKFKALYPNYEYKPMTKDMFKDCFELAKQWNIPDELTAMQNMMRYWDELDMLGGTIFVDGKLVAFTFGNPLSENTLDVNIEKADTEYEGSFTIINNEFVKHLPEHYSFINREEDMGIDGLRTSKLSYHPHLLLDKYFVSCKNANLPDIDSETRQLWKEVFCDDDTWMNYYFSNVYKPEYNITFLKDGHVVGALQTIPYSADGVQYAYISGVSVKKEYRQQGIGRILMQKAEYKMKANGIQCAVLVPASPSLLKWYESMQYHVDSTLVPPRKEYCGMENNEFTLWQKEHVMIKEL